MSGKHSRNLWGPEDGRGACNKTVFFSLKQVTKKEINK